ncbi:GNAT domain-containing protein [Aspergillus floccosus]
MDPSEPSKDSIKVKSTLPTLPLPPNSERAILTTDRLLIRPLEPTDLDAIHVLRTQPEVMQWTSTGRIDQSLEETQQKLALFLAPNDASTFNCAICARPSGELIGLGGVHLYSGAHGWPELGYMLRREFWGQGLASEFVRAWLDAWAALPREERVVGVQRATVPEAADGDGDGDEDGAAGAVRERLVAVIEASNVASQKVLLKAGFSRMWEFTEVDNADPSGVVRLVAFCYFPPR